jgi:hypothetical protein
MPGPRRNPSKPHTANLPNAGEFNIDSTFEPEKPIVPKSERIIPEPKGLESMRRKGLPVEHSTEPPLINSKYYRPPAIEPVSLDGVQRKSEDGGIVALTTDKNGLPKRVLVPARIDRLQNAFIESLGKSEDLRMALAQIESPHIQKFLAQLTNPRWEKWTTTSLARKFGIKSTELADIMRRYNMAKGMHTIINGIPQVAADIVVDAQTKLVACPRCDGIGSIALSENQTGDDGSERTFGKRKKPTERECPQCEGCGKIRQEGSNDARKLMFEAAGITGKKGTTIERAVITAHNVESVIGELETLQLSTGTAMGLRSRENRLQINTSAGPQAETMGEIMDAEFQEAE